MSLAGRTAELKARPASKRISDNENRVHQLSPTASASNDVDPTLEPPSLTTIFIQLATCVLAVMFYLLRTYQIPLMGFKIDLVYGIVPAECIMLTVVLLGLGMKEIATTFAYLQRPRCIGMEKEGYAET